MYLSCMPPQLPIDALLPEALEQLRRHNALVLSAPPGAGKTTRVPPAVLDQGLAGDGMVLLLQPRRLAARAVARMMARAMGQPLGQRVGYRVRFDDRSSPRTRLLVVTEGILLRWLQRDPLLEGVGCVVLDEFHERSLFADLALAFVREVARARGDLRVVVMSATLDSAPVAAFLGGCPALRAEERGHALRVDHVTATDRRPLEQQVRSALVTLLRRDDDDGGDVLVFLPGAPEINRVQRHLTQHGLPGAPALVPLHGSLPAAQQDLALQPGRGRRVVLATNIAETSLTVPSVTAVVDAGLVKQPRHDPGSGLDRLQTVRISRASADQRAGRAGRVAPGRALRLWTAAEHQGLPRADQPEIMRLDLAPALLALLSFQPGDPRQLRLFQPPPEPAMQRSLELLRLLGAVERHSFGLTRLGRRLVRLPVHPRIGVVLLGARGDQRQLREVALLAALLAEREVLARQHGEPARLPTGDCDLSWRRDLLEQLFAHPPSTRDHVARGLGLNPGAARQALQAGQQLARLVQRVAGDAGGAGHGSTRRLLLAGFPDRVCCRRAAGQPEAVMVGGRGVRLAVGSGVREAPLFLALRAEAGPRGLHATSLVTVASALDAGDLAALYPQCITSAMQAQFDAQTRAVIGVEQRTYRDLIITRRSGVPVDPVQAAALLLAEASRNFDEVYRPSAKAARLVARLRFAAEHLPEVSWPDASEQGLRRLLGQLCVGHSSFRDLQRADWAVPLSAQLTYRQRALLDAEVPRSVAVPSGRHVRVDYGDQPVLAVKLQELFGLAQTPRVARDRVPLLLHLLAPSGRPVQVTRDLASFWAQGYAEVRKDLRGRYPKHPWPEDPWTAHPTARAKRRR